VQVADRPNELPPLAALPGCADSGLENGMTSAARRATQLTLSYSLNNVVLTVGLGITIAPTLGEAEA
jgi:hypothetical protein